MTEELMHDSPTEFLHDVTSAEGECMAQSVIPMDGGGYKAACSCGEWEAEAPTREDGLRLAREHAPFARR